MGWIKKRCASTVSVETPPRPEAPANRRRDLAMHDLATVIDGVWVLKLGAAFEV